jgi:hypothetical protein
MSAEVSPMDVVSKTMTSTSEFKGGAVEKVRVVPLTV